MIEMDLDQAQQEDYQVRWTCPTCGAKVGIALKHIDTAECGDCHTRLSEEDRNSLLEFKKLIT